MADFLFAPVPVREPDPSRCSSGAPPLTVPPGAVVIWATRRGSPCPTLSDGCGTALKVEGKAVFSRSGKTLIPAGAVKLVVSLSGVTTSSIVLATPQKHVIGYTVESAVPAAGSSTLWLNRAAPTGGPTVGCFVLN